MHDVRCASYVCCFLYFCSSNGKLCFSFLHNAMDLCYLNLNLMPKPNHLNRFFFSFFFWLWLIGIWWLFVISKRNEKATNELPQATESQFTIENKNERKIRIVGIKLSTNMRYLKSPQELYQSCDAQAHSSWQPENTKKKSMKNL